jgi:hypothetical protein
MVPQLVPAPARVTQEPSGSLASLQFAADAEERRRRSGLVEQAERASERLLEEPFEIDALVRAAPEAQERLGRVQIEVDDKGAVGHR